MFVGTIAALIIMVIVELFVESILKNTPGLSHRKNKYINECKSKLKLY